MNEQITDEDYELIFDFIQKSTIPEAKVELLKQLRNVIRRG